MNSGYELYDNPNDYSDKSDGKTEAERRMEEEEFRFNSVSAGSTCKRSHRATLFPTDRSPQLPQRRGQELFVTSTRTLLRSRGHSARTLRKQHTAISSPLFQRKLNPSTAPHAAAAIVQRANRRRSWPTR